MSFERPPSKRQKLSHSSEKCSVLAWPILRRENAIPIVRRESENCRLLELPEEMFNLILTYLTPADIGRLSLSSHLVRRHVYRWFDSRAGLRHLAKRSLIKVDSEVEFKNWVTLAKTFGVLAKRLTMLFSTNKRIEFLNILYKKFRNFCLGEPVIRDEWNTLLHVVGLTTALAHFSSGWDDSEFGSVLEVLNSYFGFSEKMSVFLNAKDKIAADVSDLKIVLRSFYWDQSVMVGSFLGHLFNNAFKMKCKDVADVIYLMVGPSDMNQQVGSQYKDLTVFQRKVIQKKGCLPDWLALEEEIPSSYSEAKELLEDLGQVFSTLFSSDRFNNSKVCVILDHVIGRNIAIKDIAWILDNVATLLLFSSSSFIKSFISHSLRTNSPIKNAELVASMVVVCDRMENDLVPANKAGVDSIIQWLLSKPASKEEKRRLFKSFWQEIKIRCSLDDISGDILVQLGKLMFNAAFPANKEKQQLDDMEE